MFRNVGKTASVRGRSQTGTRQCSCPKTRQPHYFLVYSPSHPSLPTTSTLLCAHATPTIDSCFSKMGRIADTAERAGNAHLSKGGRETQDQAQVDLSAPGAPPSYFEAVSTPTESINTPRDGADTPAAPLSPVSPTASISSLWSPHAPPVSAQRAQAPVQIRQSNSSVSGDFIIMKDKNSKGGTGPKSPNRAPLFLSRLLQSACDSPSSSESHASLQTTNGKIDASVWVEDYAWGRPFSLEVKTSNGRIALRMVRTPQFH